ncbi:uncharacterized protein LOC134287103 [Aedes albopictus]|uniref:CCHC-type domain-containing protein n=1 Tax=Aedes albopictus TaxID=7160 RepID=A0ABM1YF14_AEDAL
MDNRLRSTILPTFNGDDKRYPFWKKRIENYFRLDDLLYVFERTPLEEEYASPGINASPQAENHRKAKMAKRLKDDFQVVNDLMLCLNDEPMGHVLNCEYAKDVIDTLDEVYLPKGVNAMLGLRSQLYLLKNRKFNTLKELFSTHEDLVRQLNLMEEQVSRQEQINTLLAAIPEKFSHILGALAVMRKDDLMNMALLQVQRIFIDADISVSESVDQQPVAYKMTNGWWKEANPKQQQHRKMLRCHECGKLAHIRRFCDEYWHKPQETAHVTTNTSKYHQQCDVALTTNESYDCMMRVPFSLMDTDTQNRVGAKRQRAGHPWLNQLKDGNQIRHDEEQVKKQRICGEPFWELPVAMSVCTPSNFTMESGEDISHESEASRDLNSSKGEITKEAIRRSCSSEDDSSLVDDYIGSSLDDVGSPEGDVGLPEGDVGPQIADFGGSSLDDYGSPEGDEGSSIDDNRRSSLGDYGLPEGSSTDDVDGSSIDDYGGSSIDDFGSPEGDVGSSTVNVDGSSIDDVGSSTDDVDCSSIDDYKGSSIDDDRGSSIDDYGGSSIDDFGSPEGDVGSSTDDVDGSPIDDFGSPEGDGGSSIDDDGGSSTDDVDGSSVDDFGSPEGSRGSSIDDGLPESSKDSRQGCPSEVDASRKGEKGSPKGGSLVDNRASSKDDNLGSWIDFNRGSAVNFYEAIRSKLTAHRALQGYLVSKIRTDTCFTLNISSQFQNDPREHHISQPSLSSGRQNVWCCIPSRQGYQTVGRICRC